jgi:hypothetical protein
MPRQLPVTRLRTNDQQLQGKATVALVARLRPEAPGSIGLALPDQNNKSAHHHKRAYPGGSPLLTGTVLCIRYLDGISLLFLSRLCVRDTPRDIANRNQHHNAQCAFLSSLLLLSFFLAVFSSTALHLAPRYASHLVGSL